MYQNESGILISPSHPDAYPPNSDCTYLISQPNGSFIKLTMIDMDIVCGGIELSDYIELRDGKLKNSPLMGKFCGNYTDVPDFMMTTQNYLRIR